MQIVTEFKPLQKVAYDHIKELVLSDSLSFNHIYSETSIAQDIGISRTPVRDALHFLSQEGLVDILPSKGFVLHRISEQDVLETYEIRSAIESYCARKLALQYGSDTASDTIDILRASLDRQNDIMNSGKGTACFAEEDMNFHSHLVSSCNNAAITNFYNGYMYWSKKLAVYSLSHARRMENTIKEHTQILDAIISGDGSAAFDAVLFHIRAPLDLNLQSIYSE